MSKRGKISIKEYIHQRFCDSDKAVQVALASQKEASIKAANALENRLELLNELREGVATKEQLDSVKKEVSIQMEAAKARHDALAKLVYIGLGILATLRFVSQFINT